MAIKGVVYYNSNLNNAINQLNQIEERYNHMEIATIHKHYSYYSTQIQFENGDVWRTIRANNNARGYRWNIAYIERSISYNMYHYIINSAANVFPYCGIHLWGEGNLHISD